MSEMIHTQDADFTLLNCDVLEGLRSLPDESVHCVVTSPPYWGLRDYGTEGQIGLEATPELYAARMVEVFREVRRVLRADGTCWVNLGDSYAGSSAIGEARPTIVPNGLKPKDLCGIPWRVAFALQADGWYLRADIIWAKPNPMPESVTDRPTKAHEYVFLLSKSSRYFFDQDAVRESASWARWGDQTTPKHANSDNGAWMKPKSKAELEAKAETGRNVRSVWEIATQPYPEAHFATYPEDLVRRCILAGSPLNGTVLDPFLGSGTTAYVARKHGRRSIGIELNADYCDLAARRMQQQSLFAVAK